MHEGSSRVLAKGALRLCSLIPGQHYSLAMALSETCLLYLTVVLGLGGWPQLVRVMLWCW